MYDPTTYNPNNPTFVNNNFTPAQKEAQRSSGQVMMEALVKAAKSGATSYTIAPGTYRVPTATYRLDNISNFIINCPNVNIWLDIEPSYPNQPDLSWINFKGCSNIKVLGGNTNFDSERLQFVQAIITGWNTEAGTLDVKVMSGYEAKDFPTKTEGNMSWTFDRKGVCRTRPSYSSFVDLDTNDVTKKRLTVGTKYFTDGTAKLLHVGDILFTRHNLAGWSGVMSVDRTNTDFEIDGINSWYGPMWAIDCSRGEFISLNCSNYRRPGTNRLGASQEPFIYANMHTLIWDNCTTGGPGQDDGIDVVGGYALVAQVRGPRSLVVFREPQVGETMSFYAPDNFAPEGEAKVVTVSPLTDTTQITVLKDEVNAFQETIGARQRINENDRFWEVTLNKDLPIRPFAGYDTDSSAPDVTITNSYFADMNAQAIFVKGHRIEISGNRIDRSNATAIHAQISRYWWEGSVPQNVNISNNIINDNPCDYGVANGMWDWVLSSIGVEVEGSLSGVGALHNVRIENNTLNNSARIPIMVKNVATTTIKNNTINAPMPQFLQGANLDYVTYGLPINGAIFIAASRDVALSGNILKSPTLYCPNLIQFGPYNDLKTFAGKDFDTTIKASK